MKELPSSMPWVASGLLGRLLRDRAGNTLAMIAAAILPLMAMIGGGVDMGRAYLSQSRLQQACDAGVLAARKKLGTAQVSESASESEVMMAMAMASEDAAAGNINDEAADIGQRFFNINFRSGAYGTENRSFTMTLEEDYAISGAATVEVPTTVMQVFGFDKVDIAVECEAQLNFSNTDVMMVVDVTSSMNYRNPDDELSRLEEVKRTIRTFHAQLEQAKQAGAEMRYGFVPFSTNVNVGALLEDDWVVDEWSYQSRKLDSISLGTSTHTFYSYSDTISGSYQTTVYDSYPATNDAGTKTCPTIPTSTYTYETNTVDTVTEPFEGPPAGTRTIEHIQATQDGSWFYYNISGNTCTIYEQAFDNYTTQRARITQPKYDTLGLWLYKKVTHDVSDWRTTSNGCIEERDTYRIQNWESVDLTQALDLDIDLVPSSSDPATQWRPQYPGIIFARSIKWDWSGSFRNGADVTTEEYVAPYWAALAYCPAPSKKLSSMSTDELNTYLDTLEARGSTYSDIGMIWGGRLISPTGIFADENSGDRQRHLIYLTDGYTYGLPLSYSSYGQEPVDRRRWQEGDTLSLTQTISKRFSFACEEVKKKGITVWVIAFGIEANQAMVDCAGDGRYFSAANAQELNVSFGKIAKNMSELRIEK